MRYGGGGLVVVVSTLVALGIGEVVVRSARDPPGYFPINHREDSLYVDHPVRGYSLKPGARHRYVTPEVDVAMDISSDGLRDTTLAVLQRADYRVLAVGNSFTMGLAVAAQDTWSKQLERLLAERGRRTVSVVNAGVAGYSPRQIRLRMEELLPIVRPRVVVFELTTQTFGRMFHPNALYGGTLVRSDVLPGLRATEQGLLYSPQRKAWLKSVDYWLNEHFELGAHILGRASLILGIAPRRVPGVLDETVPARIRELMQPTLDEVAAAQHFARAHATRFIVLLANLQRSDGTFPPLESVYNQIVEDFCRQANISYVNPLPELVRQSGGRPIFRTVHDSHWTLPAHAIAARALLDSLAR
jgi:hypothetical protein